VTVPVDTLLPGAEPFEAVPAVGIDGGAPRIGVLLCHGFTGSPVSLRPWAEHLALAGFHVVLPLLPGHGTRWEHMQVTHWEDWYAELDAGLRRLLAECDSVFVMGLSMGGALALRLAQVHGAEVRGVVLVNPSVKRNRPVEALIPVLSLFVASMRGITSDIKRPGVTEGGYERVPLKAARSLTRLWKAVRVDLPKVTMPVLLFRSATDHVVHASNSALVLARVSSADVEEVVLADSYHVATLDNDAQTIFEGAVAFVRRLSVPAARIPAADTRSELADGTGAPR
jgi:carboxylesterase